MRKVYTLNYWLKNANGDVVDTSEGGLPMTFVEGTNKVIAGIQKAVAGRSPGDKLEATIPPPLAYGAHLPELVSTMPLSAFDGVDEVLVGMKFQTDHGGEAKVVKVIAVSENEVTIDANHPLAGITMRFELEVIDVRDAAEEDFLIHDS